MPELDFKIYSNISINTPSFFAMKNVITHM